jgi:hypothetical protein
LHNSSAYSFLETFLLISVLSYCLNLNTNSLTAVYKVAAKSFLIIRSNNNNLLDKIKDSRDKCSLKLVRKVGDFILFRVLANSVQSVLIAVVTLFSLRYQVY